MRSVDLATLEARQLGLSTSAQLRDLKLSEKARRHLLDRQRLVRLRTGVFANPSVAVSFEQCVLGAVLSAGSTAFASHTTAARLWHFPLGASEDVLEVTTVLERRPRVEGVRMHRSGLLIDPDVTRLRRVPVSTPERTIFDLSSRLDLTVLGRTIDDAVRRRITSLGRLHRLIERLPPAPGRSPTKMRAALALRDPDVAVRESVLEDFVFDALRRFSLPLPVPQYRVRVGGRRRRIDLCYPDEMLALEPKGFEFRRLRQRFDEDTLRDNELELAGYRVLTFTSAFTDVKIADQVSRALGVPGPPSDAIPETFAAWAARR